MARTIRVGVIGVGSMGKNHVRVLSELDGAELVAASDVDDAQLKRVADKYRIKEYKDYQEMLEREELDAVSVVVPTTLHKKIGLDCIRKGVSVLMEKPIALTTGEARELIDSAQAHNVNFMVGHIERFNPAVVELKKRLEQKKLGRVYEITANRVGPFSERILDVGVIIDLAVHDLDVMRYLTGSEVMRLYAEAEQRIHTHKEDLFSGVLKFRNDAIAVLNVNWLTPTKVRELNVVGEKGMFSVNYLTQDLYFYENASLAGKEFAEDEFFHATGVTEGDMVRIHIDKKEPLKVELEKFIEFAQGKTPVPVSGEDGFKALFLAEKLIESAKENKVIVL
jgi:predicted dehydrogenase